MSYRHGDAILDNSGLCCRCATCRFRLAFRKQDNPLRSNPLNPIDVIIDVIWRSIERRNRKDWTVLLGGILILSLVGLSLFLQFR